MQRRPPSTPPVLPGFSPVRFLGSGGFADVFLYRQNRPRRDVAVKVMLSGFVTADVLRMFRVEADLMAQLGSHPSIITVYQASISSDGRPYLVMELCSSSLNERYRRERLPVVEVLRIAVKIGSALETVHRAGVLHRDISPSNILISASGDPVLSDFGISSSVDSAGTDRSTGISIRWAAPEVVRQLTTGTVASEVWSFAATVYSLLAGRSPFELAGSINDSVDLIPRIVQSKARPTGRSDLPESLERILGQALSHRPEARQSSVRELVEEFQGVERELGGAVTGSEIATDDWALAALPEGEARHNRGGSLLRALRERRLAFRLTMLDTIDREPPAAAGRVQPLGWLLLALSAILIIVAATVTIGVIRTSADSGRCFQVGGVGSALLLPSS